MRSKILESSKINSMQKVILLFVLENERDLYIEEVMLGKDSPSIKIPYGCKITVDGLRLSLGLGVTNAPASFKVQYNELKNAGALLEFDYGKEGMKVLRVNQVAFLKGDFK